MKLKKLLLNILDEGSLGKKRKQRKFKALMKKADETPATDSDRWSKTLGQADSTSAKHYAKRDIRRGGKPDKARTFDSLRKNRSSRGNILKQRIKDRKKD